MIPSRPLRSNVKPRYVIASSYIQEDYEVFITDFEISKQTCSVSPYSVEGKSQLGLWQANKPNSSNLSLLPSLSFCYSSIQLEGVPKEPGLWHSWPTSPV